MTKILKSFDGMQGGSMEVHAAVDSADPASIAAGAVGDVIITVADVVATDVVFVTPRALATGLVLVEAICGAGKVTVTLLNTTAGAVDDAVSAYDMLIFKKAV